MTKRFVTRLLLGLLLCVPSARAAVDADTFERDLSALANAPTRSIGTPGYNAAIDYLQQQISTLPGVDLKVHDYSVMVPHTSEATMTVDGHSLDIYPFWPAAVRLNTTPTEGLQGKLVYCGNGDYPQLAPGALDGAIAVIESAGRDKWRSLPYFGAKAVIVLGSADLSYNHLRSHELHIPVHLPRFFIPDGETATRIRRGDLIGQADVRVQGGWQAAKARNLYAYVAPKDSLPVPRTRQGDAGQPWAALTIVTSVDTSAIVPDLAPAAGQAVQPAAALAMLRDYAVNPPKRPVLFVFTGADSMNLAGTRQMLMALGDAPAKWQEEIRLVNAALQDVERDIALAQSVAGDLSKLDVTRDRTLIDRITKIIETDISVEQDEVFRLRVVPADQVTEAHKARIKQVEENQIRFNQLRFNFTANPKNLHTFGDEPAKLMDRVMTRLGVGDAVGLLDQWSERRRQLQQRIDLYQWLAGAIGRDQNPGTRNNDKRLIELMVGLDFSDLGERVGPIFWGRLFGQSSITQIQEHREWFDRLEEQAKTNPAAAWFKPLQKLISFEPLKLTRTPLSFTTAPLALATEVGAPWGIPAFSMVTLEDLRPRRDTPADTMANLNRGAIVPQVQAVHELMRRAWDDPTFVGQPEFRRNNNSFEGQVVSTASGKPIPDLPREGFFATMYYISGSRKIPQVRPQAYSFALGVRRTEVEETDAEGRYRFEALPRVGDYKTMSVKVYTFAPGSGAIIAGTDLGKQAGDIKQQVNLDETINPLKSVVFDSEEFTLTGLYDPRFLQALAEVQMMDARRNAEFQRFDAALNDQMMVGHLEPGSRAYLLFRYGRIGNRLIMLNMPETRSTARKSGVRGEGEGFAIDRLNNLGPLSLLTAQDFWRLNDSRIEQYRKAGVTSSLIDKMHQNAASQISAASAALQSNDAQAVQKNANGAWADEARVYDAAQQMANDVVYAAIFLLLLAVPFSFCMERLTIGTPNIYKQIAYTGGIFTLMAAALWLFHPAFKISSSPLIIILAFAIILMSLVVISVVYGRFDSELKRLRSGRGTAQGASFARASVLMSAVMLGIANMRRRKFRTALTSITVVLITFAVLCFTSSSRYQGTISLPTGIDSQYSGLMLRQRGFRQMSDDALTSLRASYPQMHIVERWWTLSAGDVKEQVHLVAGGFNVDDSPARVVSMQALLGLTPGESELSPIGKVVSNFDRLEKGEVDIIYLAATTAEQLKVKVGDKLKIGGRPLTLAGTYDANDFDQRVNLLSGEPIAPLRYGSGALDASGKNLSESNVDTLELDADSSSAEAGASYEHLSGNQFAIVPAEVARRLETTSLRTVGFRVGDPNARPAEQDTAVKGVVDDLTKRLALATYAGYNEQGVMLVTAGNLSSLGGGANVAIPLSIGGLIIFNTMMGSIAERRREIHVYTSLGLAPMHVGALFVTEAMTYGLIGSVFGYIIGQGAGTLLLKLGLLGNVTLNYSGTSAMMTLGLILLIVLLSALVPARLASKIAAPSIDRSWRVPAPKDGQIVASLPFTINQTAAQGVIGYLAEFFEAHQEGSIGKFSAGKIEAFTGTSEDGKPTRGLKTIVWLTPFDLGVRQHLLLLIHPGEFNEIYEVQVVLERLSGDDGSWWRMNRSFLTELRKQFLQWRSLSPQRMKEYVDQSRNLFQQVPENVVTTAETEEVRLA
ncbi:MAG TPA: ABC transporter permease [Tepidisphaeraceae bacterium]